MFHLKPWTVLEVPSGVSSEWRHVNNDAEEQFTSFCMNDDYFAVGSKYGLVEILHRVSLDQIATFKISSPAPITKIRFSEVDKQALSLNGTKVQDTMVARNFSNRQGDSSKNVFVGVVIAGWKVEVWRLIHPPVSDPKGKVLVEMKRQNSLHAGSAITAMSWASDRDLFTGDESGVVTVTRVQSRNLLTGSCQQLFKLKSPVVQIDFCAPILLVSTHTTIALSNISRQVFREVPLEKDGPFGAVLKVVDKNATFLAESVRESYLKAVCAGPDAMVWIVNVESYETERAYCFKGLVLERMKAASNMETPLVEKQNGMNKSEELVAVLPDERRPSSQLDEINLKSVEEIQSSGSSSNSVKLSKKDHLTICQLFNFGKGIVIGECSGGWGCVVLDVFNKSVMIAGKNFALEHPCSEMFVQSRQKLVTIFQPTGDLKCFLVQPIHRMMKNIATDERYKSKSAELILRFPSIACNYLTQQEISDVADLLKTEAGNSEQVVKVRELATILGNEKRARFENSNRSENEFDPYFQEVETPHSLFKTGGSTMKSLISNIQSKISDYEVTIAESKLAKARLSHAMQSHEDTATEVLEDLPNDTENLVKVGGSQITLEGIERVVFSPSEKLEPIRLEQTPAIGSLDDSDLPPIHHLADIAIDDSPIAPLIPESEESPNSDFQVKTKLKLKSFLNKVAENVETLSQKKAFSIEPQSVALEEEVCSYVEYVGMASPAGWDKSVHTDVVRSVWVVGPGNRQQLVVPQGSSSSGHRRKETELDVGGGGGDGKDGSRSKSVMMTSHGQQQKSKNKKRPQGHKQRKKERTATKTKSEGSHTPSDRDNQSVSSLSISVSENPNIVTTTNTTHDITTDHEMQRPVSSTSNADTEPVTLFDRVIPDMVTTYEDIRMKAMSEEGRFRSQTGPVLKPNGFLEPPSDKTREGKSTKQKPPQPTPIKLRHKTMQHKPLKPKVNQSQASNHESEPTNHSNEALSQSALGYVRISNCATYEEAVSTFEGIKSRSYWREFGEVSKSWQALVKMSNLLQHSPEKAEIMFEESTEILDIKLLLVLNNGNKTDVISHWVSGKLLQVQSKLELWQSSLLRSLQLFNWEFSLLRGVLLDILKSLNEALSPPIDCFKCATCNRIRSNMEPENQASLQWERSYLIDEIVSIIKQNDPTMESICADVFSTEAGAVNVCGYLGALQYSPRVADRLELCTVQLRDNSLILKEVDAILKENSDENAISLWLIILELSLTESSESQFCLCHKQSSEESGQGVKFSFTEELLFEFYKLHSIDDLRHLILEWTSESVKDVDERSEKRNLSSEFYRKIIHSEAWVMRKKQKMFKLFKKADKGTLVRRETGTFTGRQRNATRNKQDEATWKISTEVHQLKCVICNGSIMDKQRKGFNKVEMLSVFKCGHTTHASCWLEPSLCPVERCSNASLSKLPSLFDF